MYSHGLATQALCEAFALTGDSNLRAPSQLTLGHILEAQDPAGGGWRYKPKEKGDMSVTGWQLHALMLGQKTGIQTPPPPVIVRTSEFLNGVQTQAGARYGYDKPNSGGDCTTAMGLLCRIYLGWSWNQPRLKDGVEYVSSRGPKDDNTYFNYWATQLLQNYGGEPWTAWNEAMRKLLLNAQDTEGKDEGSWHLPGKHSAAGGRLYCTAMNALILQSYYRYMPIYEETRQEITHVLRTSATAKDVSTE
jgi:hypothetical protein